MMGDKVERLTFEVDGGVLSVLAAGAPEGDPVLLLHGIPANANLFRTVLPILADAGYRALAPDMPGYGGSRLSDTSDYSLSAVADRYAAWLRAERLTSAWVVGHDLGVVVAALLAVRYPHLVAYLTLGNGPLPDTFPVFSVKLAIWMAKAGLFAPIAALGPDPYMSREVRRGFVDASHITDDMWRTVFWDSKVSDPQGRKEFTKHLKHLSNAEAAAAFPQLSQLSMPSLVLWSDSDHHRPAETSGKRLLAALPRGTSSEMIAQAGHFVPLEQPAAYAQKLLQWRQKLAEG